MSKLHHAEPDLSQSLPPQQLSRWRDYIEHKIGFVLPEEQRRWLINAIESTAKKYQLNFDELWRGVHSSQQLRQSLLDEVLILESRFFRHPPSIAFVTQLAASHQHQSQHLTSQDRPSAAPFRIWSLGCASGQEVWSLAMSLQEQGIEHFDILGTDASQKALAQAQAAYYDDKQINSIPKGYRHFLQPTNKPPQSALKPAGIRQFWQVAPILQPRVRFIWHNIFSADLPTDNLQDVIICQNMLIYFRKFDQRDILNRLSQQCRQGGYIILAPGEGSGWQPENMQKLRHSTINAWQKIGGEP
ncbi:CheR family methyltransferase [Psychrobacter ciconiae]|uniref:CheR family methyltransferase n=1 Tax=Psychrobacter ciconiae TaxID=1553449 RepID=UPI001D11D73C|nr:CheR family methyltransferase [Psychrobacter ciconiae]